MKFILGTKQYMTQVWGDDGKVVPVTVVQAGPIVVTQVKNADTDGYTAVQVGFGTKKAHNINKPQTGHFKGLGNFRYVQEFRDVTGHDVGATLDASVFAPGDVVVVSGTSKGKGFQGVVKRHGFAGGRRTHGQKHSEREPGSIGGGLRTRVPKGMRMAGRMGGDTVSVKNLRVVAVDKEQGLLMISGAVPGRRGTLLSVLAQ